MSTTFDGDFNALRSPDTAPRDEVILGQFNGRDGLHLTIWDHESETWTVPQVNQELNPGSGKLMRFFLSDRFYADTFTGWLPLNALCFAEHSS